MRLRSLEQILVGSILCCLVLPAYASTSSEMHRTRAVSLLGDGKLEQARVEAQRAVQADAEDLHARFYLGLVLSRLGQYERAMQNLEVVERAGLVMQSLSFELGYAYYHLDRLPEARDALMEAVSQRGDFAPAHYYLGVVLYQLKDYEGCLKPLQQAASQAPEFGAAAAFMRGDSLVYLGRFQEAERVLGSAIRRWPDSIYTGYSQKALERMAQDKRKERPWALELAAGGSYDSNVGLFAEERALPAGIEKKSDWRGQFSLVGSYTFWEREGQSISGGYRFFQSYHNKLADYDMQNHTFTVDYRQEIAPYVTGINFQYVNTRLGWQSYRDQRVLSPYLIWDYDRHYSTFIKLRVADESYHQNSQTQRNGTTAGAQLRQYWLPDEVLSLFAGLRIDNDRARDAQYSYHGQGVEAGLQQNWQDVTIGAELLYQHRAYISDTLPRGDEYMKGDIRLSKPLQGVPLVLEAGVSYISNSSSVDAYDYRRTVANLMLRWQL